MKESESSILLWCYSFFMQRAGKYLEYRLRSRIKLGKEDPNRIEERLGYSKIDRPNGLLIWFHAASVGESLSLVELIKRLSYAQPDYNFLVTTGTVSSAKVISPHLPLNAIHQYIPIDTPKAVKSFIDFWRPDLAIWTESEFWPNILKQTYAKEIPMILINARISEKSFRKWRLFKKSLNILLSKFNHLLVQDEKTMMYLTKLGVPKERFELTGTLKEGAAALPYSEEDEAEVSKQISNRPIWLAASTHKGEEETIAAAHKTASKASQGLLLIIVPRHPERGEEIALLLREKNFKISVRSKNDKITRETQVYVADTLGELGLWYRLSPVSFVGGSLTGVGGHNPFEPAALGSAIIYGPYVQNFEEIYNRLSLANGAIKITDETDLSAKLIETLSPDNAAKLAHAAWQVSSNGAGVTDRALDLIYENLSVEMQEC